VKRGPIEICYSWFSDVSFYPLPHSQMVLLQLNPMAGLFACPRKSEGFSSVLCVWKLSSRAVDVTSLTRRQIKSLCTSPHVLAFCTNSEVVLATGCT
jgi:hypothetical protein